jgi:hypothetical protein
MERDGKNGKIFEVWINNRLNYNIAKEFLKLSKIKKSCEQLKTLLFL